jgi:DNA-directed RNA polymerase subunit RPC12/RpoP
VVGFARKDGFGRCGEEKKQNRRDEILEKKEKLKCPQCGHFRVVRAHFLYGQ